MSRYNYGEIPNYLKADVFQDSESDIEPDWGSKWRKEKARQIKKVVDQIKKIIRKTLE